MNSIQFDQISGKFIYMGRYSDFTPEIREMFAQRTKGQAICHRVSFWLMAQGLINPLNYFLQNPGQFDSDTLAKLSCSYIVGMILAVTGESDCFRDDPKDMLQCFFDLENDLLEKYKGNLNEIFQIMEYVKENNIMEEELSWLMLSMEGEINRILDHLNNEPYNLQLGDKSWNSSLGSALDIFEDYVVEEGGFRISNHEDSKVITLLKHTTLGGGDNFDISSLYIYTAKWKEKIFIYNSRLNMPLRSITIEESNIPILYYDYIKGDWLNFQEYA